jgi:hypothetical protein
VIPKIIHSIETSTVLNEHSKAGVYLEKSFDVLQSLLSTSSNEAKSCFCEERVMKGCFANLIRKTINDPSPVTLGIIKRFIKLM